MAEKRGKGRPKFFLDDAQVKQLATMAGMGMPVEQMAAILDMHKATLERLMKRDKQIKAAVLKGRATTSANVRQRLYEQINKGNMTAIIFWLKCREGWKEQDTQADEERRGSITLNYSLPEKPK